MLARPADKEQMGSTAPVCVYLSQDRPARTAILVISVPKGDHIRGQQALVGVGFYVCLLLCPDGIKVSPGAADQSDGDW